MGWGGGRAGAELAQGTMEGPLHRGTGLEPGMPNDPSNIRLSVKKVWLNHIELFRCKFSDNLIAKPGPQQPGLFGLEIASWTHLQKHSEKMLFCIIKIMVPPLPVLLLNGT